MSDQNSFEQILKKSIRNDEDIKETLNELLKEMEEVHFNANVAKTVGTTTSTLGTAVTIGSIIAAPFTGGASLLVGLGGAALSVGGGVANIVTDAVENNISNKTIERLKTIIDNKTEFDRQLKSMIDNFGEIVERLTSEGISQESAVEATLSAIANGQLDLMERSHNTVIFSALSATAKIMHVQRLGQKSIQFLAMSSSNMRFIASFFNLSTKTMKTVGKVLPIASAVFTVIDLGILIHDWTTDAPTAEVIKNLTVQIEEELVHFRSVQQILTSLRTQNETQERNRRGCTCKHFGLKVMYLNVRSINPYNRDKNKPNTTYGQKIDAIKRVINENNPDIIAFVETWLKDKHNTEDVQDMLNLHGYQIYRQDRSMDTDSAYYTGGLLDYDQDDISGYQKRRGGGIMVAIRSIALVRTGISFSQYSDEDILDAVSNFQIKWDFVCNKCDQSRLTSKTYLFSVIYRRPNKFRNESDDSYDNLNHNIVDRMTHLCSFFLDGLVGFNGMIMVGDYNLSTSNPTFRYIAMDNFVTNFARTHRGGNALDHIICYPDDLVDNETVTDPISDHCALLFDVQLGIGTEPFQTCEECHS